MGQAKATKKFEQRHLKDTLERRNGLKKQKQKQQLKAKKAARRVEEQGGAAAVEAAAQDAKPKANGDAHAFQSMSVDDFFHGGFEIPEAHTNGKKKRKRDEKPVEAASDSDEDDNDPEEHMRQLEALAENDPDFHKYLQENEPELLDADLDIGDLSDDDGPKRKKRKAGDGDSGDEELEGDGKELKMAVVKKWEDAMTEQHSLRAMKETVLAFRVAAHVSDDEEKDFKYSISDPNVYHQLLTIALKHVPEVMQYHLPVQESKSGKLHVSTEGKKFKTLAPILRSQMASITHLLDNLTDPFTLRLTLTSTLPLLPYLLSFKKIVRDLSRAVTTVWSTPSTPEATRIAAFLIMRRLTVLGDPGIRENVLKATYTALVKSSRATTVHTLAGVNLMKNSGAELWGLDPGVGYRTAFTFIRQLAIHLRTSITHNANEAYKQVYNWQYMHSLDFWSRVLAAHASAADSPLRPLIYPLVQVTLGALRLIPTATYFPLRFALIRALLRISNATQTYVPLAAALYEVLSSAEMRKPPKTSTLKPLDFTTSIRAPKSYLRTRVYQDGVGEQVAELLGEFSGLYAKSIAFPELALPVVIMLKRWLKDVSHRTSGNKNQKLNTSISLLVQKLESNSKFIEEKRAKVEFAPNNRRGVESFLMETEWEKSPLGAFLVGQRKGREQRAKVLEDSRRVEEAKRVAKEKEGKGPARREERSESESEGEDEGEEGGVLLEGETTDEDEE
ncbi:Nucleolar Complex 2 protein [Oleoguttula sp. CCFEE 5521]